MGFFGTNAGNPSTLNPDKKIRVQITYEDGVTLSEATRQVTLVSSGWVIVSVKAGCRFNSEPEVANAVTSLVIRETKSFIEAAVNAPSNLPPMLERSTQVMMKDKEFKALICDKVESELDLVVNREETSIRLRENTASREASKQRQAERDAEQQRRMDATMGDLSQYQQDYVIYQGMVAPSSPIPTTPVPRLIVPFKTGTAKLELRDHAKGINTSVEVEGVVAVDVSQMDPASYTTRLSTIADMVVARMNMVLLDFKDVDVLSLNTKVGELCSKAYQYMINDGQPVLGIQIGRLYLTGEEKKKYDYALKKRKQMEEMSDPTKMAAMIQEQQRMLRESKLAAWRAQGLTPLQGAQKEVDAINKLNTGANRTMTAKDVLATLGLDENGNVIEQPGAPGAASSASQVPMGQPQAVPAAPQAPMAPVAGAAAATTAVPGAAGSPRPKFCQNCGNPLPPSGAFCQQCGSKI